MKFKYLCLVLLSCVFLCGVTSCSNDDSDNSSSIIDKKKSELVFDTDTLKIEVGKTAALSIKQGGGDYKAIVENPEFISAELSGNILNVTSKKKGVTGIVVSDADGNYKRFVVKSMYLAMAVDKENLTIGMKIGHTDGSGVVHVTAGNGQYTAESDAPSVAEVRSIEGAKVTIKAKKQGTAHITIKDAMNLSLKVTVQVNTTDIPFTDEEKAEIMADGTQRYMWNGDVQDVNGWYDMVKTIENNQNKIGWNYYGDYYFHYVIFPGELTAGTKAIGKVQYKTGYGDDAEVSTIDNVKVEIIKNDGNTVWGIMSVVYNDYLYCGYFVEPLQ